MGSAIWAAKGNPKLRVTRCFSCYIGLPFGVLTVGRLLLVAGSLPLPRISTI